VDLPTTPKDGPSGRSDTRDPSAGEPGTEVTESMFRALVDNSSEIITVLNPDLSWRWTNAAYETQLGYPIRDREQGLLGLIHPDDQDHCRAMAQALVELAPGLQAPRWTLRLRTAEGMWRRFEAHGRNLVGISTVRGIAIFLRDVEELEIAHEELRHRAAHDPLTKLPNRNLFQELGEQSLARAQRDGTPIAVLYLDIDRFKRVNDTYGHQFGDQMLIVTAERLRGCARAGDTLARFGGDEFVLLCEHPAGEVEMLELARRLIRAASAVVTRGEIAAETGISIGIAISSGTEVTIDALLRDADVALYRAKEQGRGRAVLFGANPTD